MPIESCMKLARERLENGKIKKERVSFICQRKNKLLKEKLTEDPSKAMAQASKEYKENKGI